MSEHISDIEFRNPQVGAIVCPKRDIGYYSVADILNDLSSRLRALETTCAAQQAEIDQLKAANALKQPIGLKYESGLVTSAAANKDLKVQQ